MKRGGQMQRTPMPARTSRLVSTKPLKRGATLSRFSGGAGTPPIAARKTSRETGFPPAVKRACRARAGNGDPDQACCEACGIWLGRYGGQIQHRVARMSGGSSRPVISSIMNAGLLCGTPETGCHGLAEDRETHMGPDGAGWWLRSKQDPATEPVLLHGRDGGMTAWLTADGGYLFESPAGAS